MSVEDVIIQWIRENFEKRRSLVRTEYLDSTVGKVSVDCALMKDQKTDHITRGVVMLTCFDEDHRYSHSFFVPDPEDPSFQSTCLKELHFTDYILQDDRWMKDHGFTGEGYIRYSQTFIGKSFHWRLSLERKTINDIQLDVLMNNSLSSVFRWNYRINILPLSVRYFFQDEFLGNAVNRMISEETERIEIIQSVPKHLIDLVIKGEQ